MKKHNAVNASMMDELEATYGLFARDECVQAVVVTGAVRSFCVGMDLTGGPQGLMQIKEDEVAMEQWKDVGGVIALATSNCIKPTIVPVNGSAAGFGLTSILSGHDSRRLERRQSQHALFQARADDGVPQCLLPPQADSHMAMTGHV
ncbi:Enoyl-CoA hydratase AKT3-2 [Colletotrichum sidae]|uniref:Enoyl-CoA hydratase AKT3-2 n=1 Tax=Colletotrichum sidae TaxID=1347389 RepID=A0A4R8T2W2_9PEZI|nr:Enoyl-CoA hydratase AKT3-2 [Colletotrichum sidae]